MHLGLQKQVRRNRNLFDAEDEAPPVVATIATTVLQIQALTYCGIN